LFDNQFSVNDELHIFDFALRPFPGVRPDGISLAFIISLSYDFWGAPGLSLTEPKHVRCCSDFVDRSMLTFRTPNFYFNDNANTNPRQLVQSGCPCGTGA
jgi:hypothetical protein